VIRIVFSIINKDNIVFRGGGGGYQLCWQLSIRLAAYYIIGVLMSCIIFVPNLIALFQSRRMDVREHIDFFYNFDAYKNFFLSFITIDTSLNSLQHPDLPYNMEMAGFPIISLIAVILMFIKRKQFRQLKTGFIVLTIFAMFPFLGYVLTFFSYVSNRWMFAYAFLIAFITVVMCPYFADFIVKIL
jgi:hypothetical protein